MPPEPGSPGRRRGFAVSVWRRLREEERGGRLNRETQGGGGVSPYLSGGILREEEGGCRLNPGPREEEWVGCSMPYFDPQAAS